MVVDVVESRSAGDSNECGSSLSIVDGLKRYTQVFAEQRVQEEAEEVKKRKTRLTTGTGKHAKHQTSLRRHWCLARNTFFKVLLSSCNKWGLISHFTNNVKLIAQLAGMMGMYTVGCSMEQDTP